MAHQYEGTVQYANGQPIANVRVRLFDKDFGKDKDDDLTVREGRSSGNGRFTVTYDKNRSLDFADIYLPYLRFEYTLNNSERTHFAYIQPFKKTYQIPENPPLEFIPAKHGFQFVNRFPGFWIPFSIPSIPDIPPTSKDDIYGLCGGMVATAYDFLLANRPIPKRRRRPGRAQPLHQYLHERQVDSLDTLGKQVVRFARWMALSDEAVQRRTRNEFAKLKQKLDDGNPAPIGLVYVKAQDTLQIWQNHQVLACNYEEQGGHIKIQLYDPNYPRTNDGHLLCQSDGKGGLLSTQKISPRREKHVRGFFVMPYTPVVPPADLTIDS